MPKTPKLEVDHRFSIDGKDLIAWSSQVVRQMPKSSARHLGEAVEELIELTSKEVRTSTFRGAGLHSRTGELMRSFASRRPPGIFRVIPKVTGRKVKVEGTMGTTLPYGPVQEFGATITAKGKLLTIPLDAAKTPAGVPRGDARSFSNTFFIRSKSGNLLLVQDDGDGFTPLFVLKERVKIPARPFAHPAAERVAKKANRVTEKHLRRAVDEAMK